MASVTSLGLHTPSALSNLVSENLLPDEPSEEKHSWTTIAHGDDDFSGEEELLVTDRCVVWSQSGIVRRTFRFDIEKETVRQAVLTNFPTHDRHSLSGLVEQTGHIPSLGNVGPSATAVPCGHNAPPTAPSSTPSRQTDTRADYNEARLGHEKGHVEKGLPSGVARAVVVLLQTQAHVYFLAGTSHVIHLAFEVDSILPAAHGLIVQRKLPDRTPPLVMSTTMPIVPQSTFRSSQDQGQMQPPIRRPTNPATAAHRMQMPMPAFMQAAPPRVKRPATLRNDENGGLPRSFSLTDPLLEMGLIVTSETASSRKGRSMPQRDFSKDALTTSDTLPLTEEILYISETSEITLGPARRQQYSPLFIALTINHQTKEHTAWTVTYPEPPTASSLAARTAKSSRAKSRRQSSFGGGTGAVTPVPYARHGRESHGGATSRGSLLGPHDLSLTIHPRRKDPIQEQAAALTTSLDVELDYRGGVPGKQNRRVSSLLARADLTTAKDRMTFSDLATGQASIAPSMSYGSGKRGESLGHHPNHRTSLNASLSGIRRGSMPAPHGHVHPNKSFYDAPVDEALQDLNVCGDSDDADGIDMHDSVKRLRREVLLKRIQTITIEPASAMDSRDECGPKTKPRVFLLSLGPAGQEPSGGSSLVMGIADRVEKTLTILTFHVEIQHEPHETNRPTDANADIAHQTLIPQLTSIWRGQRVLDAVKLTDRAYSRILILSETDDGHGELSLRGPWDYLVKIELPGKLIVVDPFHLRQSAGPRPRREGSLKRVFSTGPRSMRTLEHPGPGGHVDVRDEEGRRHRIRVQMHASSAEVAQVLELCRTLLPGKEQSGDGVLLGWWEIRQWLRARPSPVLGDSDSVAVAVADGDGDGAEWTALVVVLMTMAVDFIDRPRPRPDVAAVAVAPKKRSGGLSLSSSGLMPDLECWDQMLVQDAGAGTLSSAWKTNPGWRWISEEEEEESRGTSPQLQLQLQRSPTSSAPATNQRGRLTRSVLTPLSTSASLNKKNTFLVDCASLAREFLATPSGQAATGRRGYLPTARSRHLGFRRTALGKVLVGLHLLREDRKLDTTAAEAHAGLGRRLLPVLAQLGQWLGWSDWSGRSGGYYDTEDISMDRWIFDEGRISTLEIPAPPFAPPSIYDWLCQIAEPGPGPPIRFRTLADVVTEVPTDANRTGADDHWRTLTPRTPLLIELFTHLRWTSRSAADVVEKMCALQITRSLLETLPEGIAAPLFDAIQACQARPPTQWGEQMLTLVGRDDLGMLLRSEARPQDSSRLMQAPTQEATHDVHQICNATAETESIGQLGGAAEIDRQAITRLIFRDDRRFIEAVRLVQSSRTSVVPCLPEADWSDTDLLEAQMEAAQIVALRTLAIPAGRGVLFFRARVPLLTERFPIPGFNLSCVMIPSGNTVSADKTAFTEEKVGWAFFHAGVAAGLSISREAPGIDTSWVVFNKPAELSNRHAGFLLALGLNGHLRAIARWVAFKYLTPKHTMTSIGLLLGLSASYLGTMDTLVTRILSIHVTRMLPPGAADLNLSPLTQTTGLMGIGLLYCHTQHRRMSEIMLSEIEHTDHEDTSTPMDSLRDEGYRLAAGFALGLINLGKGADLAGLQDLRLVPRLLSIAVGPKEASVAHVVDKATAGATIALALVFQRTHNVALAEQIDIPNTLPQFDYVRPDMFLLRTLARHLIMWDAIAPSPAWIERQLPAEWRNLSRLTSLHALSTDQLPLLNILAGLCFAVALRFAGTARASVRDLLLHYLHQFIRLSSLPAHTYDAKLTLITARHCQDLLALCCATVMAGTGDLKVFRPLRGLHGRFDAITPYGSHLAAHLAIGVLFLGGGSHTFATTPLATASLLCAFYPLFPTTITDNKSHLQAFRHFWVLATEPRCLIARDVDSSRPISIPLAVTLRSNPTKPLHRTAPCLLPPLDDILQISSTSPTHWRVVLDFAHHPAHRLAFSRSQTIFLRHQRTTSTSHSHQHHQQALNTTAFHTTLLSLHNDLSCPTTTPLNPLATILTLPRFRSLLDRTQRGLVLPSPTDDISTTALLTNGGVHAESGVVDATLLLDGASRFGAVRARDRLVGLRCLFVWDDWKTWLGDGEKGGETRMDSEMGGLGGSDGHGEDGDDNGGGDMNDATRAGGEDDGWIGKAMIGRLRTRVWLQGREEMS